MQMPHMEMTLDLLFRPMRMNATLVIMHQAAKCSVVIGRLKTG